MQSHKLQATFPIRQSIDNRFSWEGLEVGFFQEKLRYPEIISDNVTTNINDFLGEIEVYVENEYQNPKHNDTPSINIYEVHCEVAYIKWTRYEKILYISDIYIRPCALERGIWTKIFYLLLVQLNWDETLECIELHHTDNYLAAWIDHLSTKKIHIFHSIRYSSSVRGYQVIKRLVTEEVLSYFDQKYDSIKVPSKRDLQSNDQEKVILYSNQLKKYIDMTTLKTSMPSKTHFKECLEKDIKDLEKKEKSPNKYENLCTDKIIKEMKTSLDEIIDEIENNNHKIDEYYKKTEIKTEEEFDKKLKELRNLIFHTQCYSSACMSLKENKILPRVKWSGYKFGYDDSDKHPYAWDDNPDSGYY